MASNYERLMDEMTPRMMTYLLSSGIFINACSACSLNASSCDHKCDDHILEWLEGPQDDRGTNLIIALKVAEEILG